MSYSVEASLSNLLCVYSCYCIIILIVVVYVISMFVHGHQDIRCIIYWYLPQARRVGQVLCR